MAVSLTGSQLNFIEQSYAIPLHLDLTSGAALTAAVIVPAASVGPNFQLVAGVYSQQSATDTLLTLKDTNGSQVFKCLSLGSSQALFEVHSKFDPLFVLDPGLGLTLTTFAAPSNLQVNMTLYIVPKATY